MLVVNLVSWSGPNSVCAINEEIDLPEATALARIEAGLCRLPEKPIKPTKAHKYPITGDTNDG